MRLANVNAALARIDEGKYGVCEVCGERIEEDRLKADPSAPTCKEHMSN
ncbi:MAG: TraR/DksA C4-type zinc finger protein [Parcubacteria group bacterium]|nr:TraR/DksA C4-type zinc finger protein [Parcubacteria group bacterium]